MNDTDDRPLRSSASYGASDKETTMFMRRFLMPAVTIAFVALSLSCSQSGSSGDSPTAPSVSDGTTQAVDSGWENNRHLWSYSLFKYDPDTNRCEVIPVRLTASHWNVLKFLEQGPGSHCVKVLSVADSDHGTKLFEVEITHPFANPNLTGFDVRGIAMFYGNRFFPTLNVSTPDRRLGDGELINATGYTTLYHDGTQGCGPSGLQGYLKGNFATATVPATWGQGFIEYHSYDPDNERTYFPAGTSQQRTYDIDMPESTFVFGYAVDASWVQPTTKPVTDPNVDFPPEANCPEPYWIVCYAYPYDYGLTDEGGFTNLYIRVYDYQGYDTHAAPVVECPELFPGTITATLNGYDADSSEWEVLIENQNLAPAGYCQCLVKVEDNENATAPDWLDLTAYQVYNLEVIEMPHGWAKTWGGDSSDEGTAVGIDQDNNVYVTGCFYNIVDFDPGTETDDQMSSGWSDVFLSKFDPEGEHIWTKAWGGVFYDEGKGIVIDFYDNVYVTGFFRDDTDFDPGSGTDIHTGSGAFLSKFDTDGNFIWAKTWGNDPGPTGDIGFGVALSASADKVFVVGAFNDTVDFDPGAGVVNLVSNGFSDVFVTCFDSDGVFLWAEGWGGPDPDVGYAINTDYYPTVYVAGHFSGSVDFDPGIGTDIQAGLYDAFLSRLDGSGNYYWAKAWGGTGYDYAYGVDINSMGAYVVGSFENTVDFDPGVGDQSKISAGVGDAYMSFFFENGNFSWVKTWGSTGEDCARCITTRGDFKIYVTGWFEGTVDFDPGLGSQTYGSAGWTDVYLSKFANEDLEWARIWGGPDEDRGYGACWDWMGTTYVTGYYTQTVDFDPGPGTDNHTSEGARDAFLSKFPINGSW
jgi:hypothetical protein